jgi:hypothetical protein
MLDQCINLIFKDYKDQFKEWWICHFSSVGYI